MLQGSTSLLNVCLHPIHPENYIWRNNLQDKQEVSFKKTYKRLKKSYPLKTIDAA